MKSALLLAPVLLASSLTVHLPAQSGKILDKTYPANGRPELQVAADNSSVHAQSCGTCREVRIHVDTRDRNLADFRLQESQTGNLIRFSFKEAQTRDWHFGGVGRQPEITVLLPTESNVKLATDNGAVSLSGVAGNIDLRSDNGALTLQQSRGTLFLTTDNGHVGLKGVEGALHAKTDNGAIEGDGRFTSIDARTSNGAVHLTALEGSALSSGAHVSTSNGSVQLRLPRGLRADVDLHTSQGGIHCNLPLSGQTSDEDRHHVRGTLNGGGAMMRVATDNGSITVDGE